MMFFFPYFLYLFFIFLFFTSFLFCYRQPTAEELSWMPTPRTTTAYQIESIILANSLNPPSSLYAGFSLFDNLFITTHIQNHRHFNLTCNIYNLLIDFNASSFSPPTSTNIAEPNILDLNEILQILDKLPPLSFQMATIAPKKVPLGLSSILTPPSSSEIEEAATIAGISTSSELFRTIKQVCKKAAFIFLYFLDLFWRFSTNYGNKDRNGSRIAIYLLTYDRMSVRPTSNFLNYI